MQLTEHPEWLPQATDFITVAGEDYLVTSQFLDKPVQIVNKVLDTNLSYEGTRQFARDIQVFRRLNEESFRACGVFSTPENAKAYLENALKLAKENKTGKLRSLECKITGTSQEVDWLRMKQGQLSSIFEKSTLLEKNAPGVDGITFNRFTGKTISRTTVKASKKTMNKSSTAIKDVKEAIMKETATEKDIIYGPKGTKEAAYKAGLTNPVIEKNTTQQIKESNTRLERKILDGQATTQPTLQQVGGKMVQGAVVGAVVAVTISGITTYVRYKNGELSKEEAFSFMGEDAVNGALVGGAMGAITIFLPGGVIGFVGGVAIGVYINASVSNILDEIYGRGAYGAILNASGYVYGMTYNLADYYKKIGENNKHIQSNIAVTRDIHTVIENNFDEFDKLKRR